MTWYKLGTVSVAQNSNAVIGTGTAFIANGRVGDAWIGPDNGLYEVTNIASDTALSISPPFKGPTIAGGAYALAPMQGYVKDTADALRQASLEVGGALDGLEESVQQAAQSAQSATESKDAAALSAVSAGDSAAAALTSKNAAAVSEGNASGSAGAALTSKDAAATSEENAAQSAAAALASKNAAATSEQNAAASAASAANIGVGKGYIDGFTVIYNGTNSITVKPGSAYIPSLGRVISSNADINASSLTIVTGWNHIYLYESSVTPAIELSTTDPVKYFGSAQQKNGDASRRYLFSILGSASNAMYGFRHNCQSGRVTYTYGNPGAAPFVLTTGFSGTSSTALSCASVVPISATYVAATVSTAAAGVVFGTDDQVIGLSGANWQSSTRSNMTSQMDLNLDLTNNSRNLRVMNTAAGSVTAVYCNGYFFER